jgi:hypothetical protein
MTIPKDEFAAWFQSTEKRFAGASAYPFIDETVYSFDLLSDTYTEATDNSKTHDYLEFCLIQCAVQLAIMGDGFSVELGRGLFEYLEDRVSKIVGLDSNSLEWKHRISALIRRSLTEASHVQCVGMARPVPISQLYQPTRMLRGPSREEVGIDSVLVSREDAIVFAGPGS